ncbi:hypothetical protein P4U43_08120 [Arthrobacter sp. EH-1B-1]|uniref:Membrane transporter protein n=1 Tax=Arthrobacter vasquezii TaxID=2977629 RepID=A0ABT6CV41_9MICC|nr:hypothetical protein [Arthrobacter vasquezii]MDF9277753.1 hypothetical protein [Arthrobacter vasquezii]
MGDRSTPLANAFFRMVIFGGMVGAATSLVLHITGSFTSAFPHILTVITHAGIAFAVGIPVTAAAAAPAVGLHNLVSVKASRLRIPAAVLGAVLGPVVAVGLLVGSSPFDAPIPEVAWVLFLPAAALAAVYFTRPLRKIKTSSSSDR